MALTPKEMLAEVARDILSGEISLATTMPPSPLFIGYDFAKETWSETFVWLDEATGWEEETMPVSYSSDGVTILEIDKAATEAKNLPTTREDRAHDLIARAYDHLKDGGSLEEKVDLFNDLGDHLGIFKHQRKLLSDDR